MLELKDKRVTNAKTSLLNPSLNKIDMLNTLGSSKTFQEEIRGKAFVLGHIDHLKD